jgi:ribosomal protein L11 methyltransferase
MSKAAFLWRIEIDACAKMVDTFEQAMTPFCDVLSLYIKDDANHWRIEGVCAQKPERRVIESALRKTAASLSIKVPDLRINALEDKDWLAENRRSFSPFRVGCFDIREADGKAAIGRKYSLRLNTGAAFGSGRHPSTRLSLLALEDLARRTSFHNILDMGCGAGILSLAAAKLWRGRILATDLDPQAITTTRRNARLNEAHFMVRAKKGDGYEKAAIGKNAGFDLVVSNILANPLCAMAKSLSAHLAPQGVAVLSGFKKKDAGRVLYAHRAQGLVLVQKLTDEDWQALVMQKV